MGVAMMTAPKLQLSLGGIWRLREKGSTRLAHLERLDMAVPRQRATTIRIGGAYLVAMTKSK
jgi:hypothetical protein